ncbi:MAG: hypothetical protein ACTS27_12090, partial [Phycisphaerales bacterium]
MTTGGAVGQSDVADRAVERYLERLGQRSLLIEHLDDQLSSVSGPERAALAERLTSLVAEELESARTPKERASLERRARALLEVIPEADSIDLRLSLHRATYSNAEEIAERWRLRLASAEEVEEAKRVFAVLATELARLGSTANRRVENLERLEESSRTGLDEEEIARQLTDARRQRSLAMYLSAWCLTYQAELDNARGPALEALPRFGWLLNAPPGEAPAIERLPEHTLAYEHVARAALGVAAAIGVAGDTGLAERWISMVEEAEGVDPAVLAQAGKRRMIILAGGSRWTELNLLVKAMRGGDSTGEREASTPLDPITARLVAVLAFEGAAGRERPAQVALRQTAFADLIARNEIGQVVDLAGRYGTEALGGSGFVPDYVRGLQAYRAAATRQRDAGEADSPTNDPSIREQFLVAIRLFDSALDSPDASAHSAARADALMLAASSAFLASKGEPRVALEAAERATEAFGAAQDDARRADALWLRVRALREAAASNAQAANQPSAKVLAVDAAQEFVELFPDDQRAAALVLERASHDDPAATNDQTIEALLAIDPSSPSYDAARRRAAVALFTLANDAPDETARREALRFVEVAGPILEQDARRALAGERSAGAEAVLLARQILSVLLDDSVREAGLSVKAAERFDALARAGFVDDPAVLAELRYRQLQIALYSDNASGMRDAAAALRAIDTDAAARFIDAADRLLYRRAVVRWQEAPDDASRAADVVE